MKATITSGRFLNAAALPQYNMIDGALLFVCGAIAGQGYLAAAAVLCIAGMMASGVIQGLMAKRARRQASVSSVAGSRAGESSSQSREVSQIVGNLLAELERSEKRSPSWPSDPIEASYILQDKASQLRKAVRKLAYEPHTTSRDDVELAALRSGAMAIRFLMSIDHYDWTWARRYAQLSER